MQQNLKIWKFASQTMAGVLNRFSFATAAEKQLKQRKHCKKHCFLVVSLEEVVFREGNCQGNRKLRAIPAWHFARAIQRRNEKTNMVKPRRKWFGPRLNNSLNCLAGLWTFLRLKDVKISLHIIVLIVRSCFDRIHGLNKLFLHLMRALCLCLLMISYLVFFHVYY